jgi:hypothetical protein
MASQPTSLSSKVRETHHPWRGLIRIMDESLIPLGLVSPARREHMVACLKQEIAQQRLPKQRVRIQPRVVKRVRSRYERKKPEHLHSPPLELDLDFHHIIALLDNDSRRPILLN